MFIIKHELNQLHLLFTILIFRAPMLLKFAKGSHGLLLIVQTVTYLVLMSTALYFQIGYPTTLTKWFVIVTSVSFVMPLIGLMVKHRDYGISFNIILSMVCIGADILSLVSITKLKAQTLDLYKKHDEGGALYDFLVDHDNIWKFVSIFILIIDVLFIMVLLRIKYHSLREDMKDSSRNVTFGRTGLVDV